MHFKALRTYMVLSIVYFPSKRFGRENARQNDLGEESQNLNKMFWERKRETSPAEHAYLSASASAKVSTRASWGYINSVSLANRMLLFKYPIYIAVWGSYNYAN